MERIEQWSGMIQRREVNSGPAGSFLLAAISEVEQAQWAPGEEKGRGSYM
jgi:hypothetical protein